MIHKYAIVSDKIPSSLPEKALRSCSDAGDIDYDQACKQHNRYRSLLEELGLTLLTVNIDDENPDSVFVEDTCIIVDKKVLLTRLGHLNREAETKTIRRELDRLDFEHNLGLTIVEMSGDARLDGGDVLFTGTEFFVGITSRSNLAGFNQLKDCFETYPCHPVNVKGLHLKSVCSIAGHNLHGGTVIVTGSSTEASDIAIQIAEQQTSNYQFITVPDDAAANCLAFNKHLIVRAEYPNSIRVFRKLEIPSFHVLSNTELAKVDGALTCCSIIF